MYLNTGFVQVTNVGSRLSRLVSHHDALGLNETKGINDYFSLDRLNGVHDDSHGSLMQRFKTLQGGSNGGF